MTVLYTLDEFSRGKNKIVYLFSASHEYKLPIVHKTAMRKSTTPTVVKVVQKDIM
jgi:hypothetical protein